MNVTVFRADEPECGYAPPDGTMLLAYRGSVAHNMYVPKNDPKHIDDIDLIGFVFGSVENYLGLKEWGSRGTQEVKDGPYDVVLYELQKAFRLLLQGNPNVLTALWTHPTHMLIMSDGAKELIAQRSIFAGKHTYNAFSGYAYGQLTRMESRDSAELEEYLGVTAELKRRGAHPNHKGEEIAAPDGHPAHFAQWGADKLITRLRHFQKKGESIGYMGDKRKRLVLEHGYDSKNAAHLIRLLRMCKEFMETGELGVYRIADRDELLSIKRGEWPLTQVKELATQLFEEAKEAKERSTLPDEPDYAKAEGLLIDLLWCHLAPVHYFPPSTKSQAGFRSDIADAT
jgi:hypothetical protein